MLYYIISYHIISCHIILYHIMSYHMIDRRRVISHALAARGAPSYRVVPRRILRTLDSIIDRR